MILKRLKHSRNIYNESLRRRFHHDADAQPQKGVHCSGHTGAVDRPDRTQSDRPAKVKYVVLDEADEMLNMGFRDDIDFVLKNTINRESIWLFSATMPPSGGHFQELHGEPGKK